MPCTGKTISRIVKDDTVSNQKSETTRQGRGDNPVLPGLAFGNSGFGPNSTTRTQPPPKPARPTGLGVLMTRTDVLRNQDSCMWLDEKETERMSRYNL